MTLPSRTRAFALTAAGPGMMGGMVSVGGQRRATSELANPSGCSTQHAFNNRRAHASSKSKQFFSLTRVKGQLQDNRLDSEQNFEDSSLESKQLCTI